jgi:hypothetical protein
MSSGCRGQDAAPKTSPSTPAPATTTPRPILSASGPLSGDELVWLEAVGTLHKAMDSTPTVLKTDTMRSFADTLGSCTHRLDGLGTLTDRLQPVYEIAKQGCAQYEKGSQCFATAANYDVVVAGSDAERKQSEAVDCAIAAIGEGSRLFAEAEGKGFAIRQAAQ